MAAYVDPSPSGWVFIDDAVLPEPVCLDDDFSEDPWVFRVEDVPEDLIPDDDPEELTGEVGWSVPGVDAAGEGVGAGMSRSSRVALAETAAAVRSLRRVSARCYRALNSLAASGAVAETGYRSLSRLVEDHVRLDQAEAGRLARHAAALSGSVSPTGAMVPARLPATAVSVDEGTVGPGHVEVVERTVSRLEFLESQGVVDADTVAATEEQLAGLAGTRSPAALARAAAAVFALLDPDGSAPEDEPPPENELRFLRRRDGSLHGKFVYRDPAAAELLETALAAATPPPPGDVLAGYDGRGPAGAHGERGESPTAHGMRTLPERRAHALLDLAGEAMTRGLDVEDDGAARSGHAQPTLDTDTDTDGSSADDARSEGRAADADAGSSDPAEGCDAEPGGAPPGEPPPTTWQRPDVEGGERVALTLTIDHETLRRRLGEVSSQGWSPGLGLLGDTTWIRPETARRLACDAELVPILLGARGEPLDVGRRQRTVPLAVRRAVAVRDRHCAHPGCRRRARRCQVHHITAWIDGGDTCLENSVLLCSYHHQLIHHGGWEIRMIDGLPWFTPPDWLDPTRAPRHNRPWQPI